MWWGRSYGVKSQDACGSLHSLAGCRRLDAVEDCGGGSEYRESVRERQYLQGIGRKEASIHELYVFANFAGVYAGACQ